MEDARKPLLLIVDDDPLITDTLSFSLGARFDVITSHSRPHAIQMLQQLRQPPAAALIDLGLPPSPHRPDEGFALIGELLGFSRAMRIVVLSGQSDQANARHARTLGAVDFAAKPCDPGVLGDLLERALAFRDETPQASTESLPMVGESAAMNKLRAQIGQYADSPFPILIEGESGSGKEIVARCCLMRDQRRRHQPFLALNCAAISPTLVEPTLFGYARGAFTGAVAAKAGYFEEAADGTLFLDEIGELPLELQAKLLRVLENGEFQRVGETQTRISRARIIAATNRDLRREVKSGRFRADLYHRLSVFSLNVPPLRDMDDDRRLLLDHFRMLYAAQAGQPPFTLDDEAAELWRQYDFPGNVRELRNITIRLVAKYPGVAVHAEQLRDELDFGDVEGAGREAGDGTVELPGTLDAMIRVASRQLEGSDAFDLDGMLRTVERGYIEAALRLTHGNVSAAAKLLGVNRTTLYNRMDGRDPKEGP